MLTKELTVLGEAADTVWRMSEDDKIRRQCEAREKYYKLQRTNERLFEIQMQKIAERDEELAKLDEELAKWKEKFAKKEAELIKRNEELAEKDREIERLKQSHN